MGLFGYGNDPTDRSGVTLFVLTLMVIITSAIVWAGLTLSGDGTSYTFQVQDNRDNARQAVEAGMATNRRSSSDKNAKND